MCPFLGSSQRPTQSLNHTAQKPERTIMKSSKSNSVARKLQRGVIAAILIFASQAVFANSEPHPGYLSTPRGREEIPALTRRSFKEGKSNETGAAVTTSNRALANSPRYREENPIVIRSSGRFTVQAPSLPPAVLKNRAFAASPRAREEFPALQRSLGVDANAFQVAPLK